MPRLDLPNGDWLWRSYPFELSGGMQQRVGIAMAMLLPQPRRAAGRRAPPAHWMCWARRQVLAELARLRQLFGTAIVLVTHDIAVAEQLATRCWYWQCGAVAELAPPPRVLRAPKSACTPRAFGRRAPAGPPHRKGECPITPILEARGLTMAFPRRGREELEAVHDVSFRLERGQALGVVGGSGSGKSTLARLLVRLLDPTAGTLLLDGRDVTRARGAQLRQVWRSVQMVFQSPAASFDPRRTLLSAVAEPLQNAGLFPPGRRAPGPGPAGYGAAWTPPLAGPPAPAGQRRAMPAGGHCQDAGRPGRGCWCATRSPARWT